MGSGLQHALAGAILVVSVLVGMKLQKKFPGIWIYFFAAMVGFILHNMIDRFFW
ncbi:hypothetical protein KY343_06960 [Candidatus Woesearchaeota archaeon]|nr:hypothetical protein [Candidatus Woesearchaeota archaeon]